MNVQNKRKTLLDANWLPKEENIRMSFKGNFSMPSVRKHFIFSLFLNATIATETSRNMNKSTIFYP